MKKKIETFAELAKIIEDGYEGKVYLNEKGSYSYLSEHMSSYDFGKGYQYIEVEEEKPEYWTDWVKCDPDNVPDLKAGEYQVKSRYKADEFIVKDLPLKDAIYVGSGITHYRTRLQEGQWYQFSLSGVEYEGVYYGVWDGVQFEGEYGSSTYSSVVGIKGNIAPNVPQESKPKIDDLVYKSEKIEELVHIGEDSAVRVLSDKINEVIRTLDKMRGVE